MKKVKRVKIKFKVKNIFILLLIIGTISLFSYILLSKRINNIYVIGNNYLSEQDVLEIIDYDNYLKYYQINTINLEKRLKTSLLIKDVSVSKTLFSLTIKIEEHRILWQQEYDGNLMLSSGETIYLDEKVLGIPNLMNVIDEEYKMDFVKELNKRLQFLIDVGLE